MLKYHIRTNAYQAHLFCSPIKYDIKIYAMNNNNKVGITYNMVRKYLTFGNTPREANQNSIKTSLKIGRIHFLVTFREKNRHNHKNCTAFHNVTRQ